MGGRAPPGTSNQRRQTSAVLSGRNSLPAANSAAAAGGACLRLLPVVAAGAHTKSENHELGRLDRRDANLANEPAVVDIVLRHRCPIALDEECIVGPTPDETAVPPYPGEKVLDRLADRRPRRLRVGFEHDPLQTPVDRLLEEDEQPP